MREFNYTSEQLSKQINNSFKLLIDNLEAEDVISEDQKEQASFFKVVVHDRGLFGRALRKFFGGKEGYSCITIVKLLRIKDEE